MNKFEVVHLKKLSLGINKQTLLLGFSTKLNNQANKTVERNITKYGKTGCLTVGKSHASATQTLT